MEGNTQRFGEILLVGIQDSDPSSDEMNFWSKFEQIIVKLGQMICGCKGNLKQFRANYQIDSIDYLSNTGCKRF